MLCIFSQFSYTLVDRKSDLGQSIFPRRKEAPEGRKKEQQRGLAREATPLSILGFRVGAVVHFAGEKSKLGRA